MALVYNNNNNINSISSVFDLIVYCVNQYTAGSKVRRYGGKYPIKRRVKAVYPQSLPCWSSVAASILAFNPAAPPVTASGLSCIILHPALRCLANSWLVSKRSRLRRFHAQQRLVQVNTL